MTTMIRSTYTRCDHPGCSATTYPGAVINRRWQLKVPLQTTGAWSGTQITLTQDFCPKHKDKK